jgi:hypothetical protein
VDPEIAKSLRSARSVGQNIYEEFLPDRIESAITPLTAVMKKPNVYTFANRPPVKLSKKNSVASTEKANTVLVTKMFMSLQSRPEADINDFFKHENRREPPSLSQNGGLRSGTKSAVIGCLPGIPQPGHSLYAKDASNIILDMAVVVHYICTTKASTFGEYIKLDILPYIESLVTDATTRVDAVWDRYFTSSLKWHARMKR